MVRLVNYFGMSLDDAWRCSLVEYMALTGEAVAAGRVTVKQPLPTVEGMENELRLKGVL